MDNIGAAIAIVFIIAIAFLVIGLGVTIVDLVTSEAMESIDIECVVDDKYVDTQGDWDKYRLIVIDNEGNTTTVGVTLDQYSAIEINDTITVSKTATKSIIFGTTYDYAIVED